MAMSNILSVFNPPPSRPWTPEEIEADCLPCTAMQSVFALLGGAYLSTNYVFTDYETGKIDLNKHPLWWRRTVRSAGVLIVGLGAYRAGEVFQMLWKRRW